MVEHVTFVNVFVKIDAVSSEEVVECGLDLCRCIVLVLGTLDAMHVVVVCSVWSFGGCSGSGCGAVFLMEL